MHLPQNKRKAGDDWCVTQRKEGGLFSEHPVVSRGITSAVQRQMYTSISLPRPEGEATLAGGGASAD